MRGITRDLANVSQHMSINGTHSKVGQTHLWQAQSLLLGINLSFQLAVSIWGDKSHSGVWQVMWPPDCHVKCVQSNPWSFIFTSSTLIAPYLLNLALDVWATLRFLLLIFEPAVIGIANTPKTSRLNTASIFSLRPPCNSYRLLMASKSSFGMYCKSPLIWSTQKLDGALEWFSPAVLFHFPFAAGSVPFLKYPRNFNIEH